MKRREFIKLLGGAAVAWPLAARAQQPMPMVGYLHGASPDGYAPEVAAFLQGLKESGYVVGQNVAVEYRWAGGRYDRLGAMAADLVRRQVTVIASGGIAATQAAKAATTTIPIVFSAGDDPVKSGLVTNLNRPSGNLTGVSTLSAELGPKRLELLHELLPAATTVAVLVNPANPLTEALLKELRAAARTFGLQLHVLEASTERDFNTAFATMIELRAGALLIGSDVLFISQSKQLAALTIRHAMPTIFQFREFPVAGGLMSYSSDLKDQYRQVGVYTGRILKGEKPADLPILQSTKAELIVNLKTAKALGITFPNSLIGRADEVIE
jgi:putative tryptophan/tyrosine transport system substrate-binding protein